MNKRITRKQILAGLPQSASNSSWVVSGNVIGDNHHFGLTKPVGKKRYLYTYVEEHHCFVRLCEVSKADNHTLAKAHNLGITREDVGLLAEAKRREIAELEQVIRDLWQLKRCPEGYFPYSDRVVHGIGLHRAKHNNYELGIFEGDWDIKGTRFGYKRENYLVDHSLSVFKQWLQEDAPDHINGKMGIVGYTVWADVLYAKMRYLITGSLPKFGAMTKVNNKGRQTREDYFLEVFEYSPIADLVDYLEDRREGWFACESDLPILDKYLKER